MRSAPLLTLAAVLAVCGSIYLFGETASPHELTESGFTALGRSDYGGAADDFEAAVRGLDERDDQLPRATVGLVRALSHFDPEGAKERFLAFANARPDDAPAGLYLSISDEMFTAGGTAEAIQILHAGMERYDQRTDLADQMSRFKAEATKAADPEAVQALASLGYLSGSG